MPATTVEKQPDAANKGAGGRGDGDQKYVPFERLEEETAKRQALETQLAKLEGKIDGISAAAPKPKTEARRDFSRADLRSAVDSGKVTQAEADAIWDDQQTRKSNEALAAAKAEVVTEITESAKIGSQIEQYKTLVPDLADKTSASFKQTQAEFDYLVNELGMNRKDLKTELAALRAAFGPPDKLTAKGKDGKPESHAGTASRGGGTESGQKTAADTPPRDLSPRLKNHYQRGIENRRYTGWDDPNLLDELKRVRSTRQRAA